MTDLGRLKRDLLAAYHVLDIHGQNAGIAGHLTARQPGGDSFWCHGHGQGFEEVRAADLHHADMELNVLVGPGRINPSHVIHAGLYRARPDLCCVIHTHSIALSATGVNLKPLFQSALMFEGGIALHREHGGIVDTKETGEELARALGPGRALLLVNHGTLAVGSSIGEAVHCAIMLDEARRFLLSDAVPALRWNHHLRRTLAAKRWLAAELAMLA